MSIRQRIFILTMVWFAALGSVAQETEERQVEYEAMQTDYGYFGTTDAIFSQSETVICTFSLTQNKPKGDKIYPTMLSIWLHADALATKSQELTIKQIASAGSRVLDGQFRHPATLLLENDEQVELNFSINNLTEDYTHYTMMLTAPVSSPRMPVTTLMDRCRRSMASGMCSTTVRRVASAMPVRLWWLP